MFSIKSSLMRSRWLYERVVVENGCFPLRLAIFKLYFMTVVRAIATFPCKSPLEASN